MKCKVFIGVSIVSAVFINIVSVIDSVIEWENAYIFFWVAVCTLCIGIIGAIACGGGKKLLEYLEKII